MRFIVVRKDSSNYNFDNDTKTYEGMDRPKLGSFSDIPELILYRGLALDDLPPQEAETAYQRLMAALFEIGITEYELLVLGDSPPSQYKFLGYDVGETAKTAWSAILNQDTFLNTEEKTQWEEKLNTHGLFQEREEAEAFLARYLDSDDPDMGWDEHGWTNAPNVYEVIPVYRYSKS